MGPHPRVRMKTQGAGNTAPTFKGGNMEFWSGVLVLFIFTVVSVWLGWRVGKHAEDFAAGYDYADQDETKTEDD